MQKLHDVELINCLF